MSNKNSREMDAIEAIYTLLDNFKEVSKKIDIIDNNIKLLNNKVAKLSKEVGLIKGNGAQQGTQPTAVAVQNNPASKRPSTKSDKLVIGNIKTFGYIANKSGNAITDVEINIYDENNQVIKNKKTDKNGYWEARLPPGNYGVEYKRKGFKAVNLNISLDETIREFEVGK